MQLLAWQADGCGHLQVCIVKTPYSFSTAPKQRGAPTGHRLHMGKLRLTVGAEFVVAICGDIMTMPGLLKLPSTEWIDIDEAGRLSGLF